jgi:hypothetical protein
MASVNQQKARMRRSYWVIALAVGMASSSLRGSEPVWRDLADPVVEDGWIRPPADEKQAKAGRGSADGLQIGLAPLFRQASPAVHAPVGGN